MIYVGRAEHEGDMLVCKVMPSKQIGYISQRGEALPKDIFEMLCGENLVWVKCYDHVIPETAVLCGRTSLEQPVYIGRGHYEGHLIIGKISSVHRALFIAYRGAERRLDSYEILIEERGAAPGWQLPPPPDAMELAEKCPQTPPPPPPPPGLLTKPPVARKPYPYPPDFDAVPFSLHDRPPQYTPMPMPSPSTDPYPPPPPPPPAMAPPTPLAEPTILPQYKRPLAVPVPIPAKHYDMPPSYAAAAVAPSTHHGSTFVPAETYKPAMNLDPYAPSCSSYTPAVCAPAATTSYDLWMAASPGYTPPDAVYGGHDTDMAPLLVCRAYYDGSHIPGKAAPSRGCAYITHAGRELVESRYEVLIGQSKYHWVPGYDGCIAAGAVEAGRAFNGEPLYIGRAHYCGSLTPGKIQQSHRCLHIPFGGQEVRISSYEILVRSEIYHRQQAINLSY
ncbi:uncharacterized protein LOC111595724 [Drosophila hydei]|uniref:Uncharacterized protein LOC111595724 n=1 Tax=Drosophila hydei TaxID=7224 RepID=A0A6J1LGF9_DROHY|nr:uncharacterized protein LOC111595724 [Drosophila hydei]